MSKFRLTLKLFVAALFTLTLATMAQAQATRTWVSGVGDDVNPCSRTAPCKTFAGAISKTATGGEIDAIDPGGFGTINITKSITIDGAGTMASILAAGTTGVIVNATATSTVVLKNLSINGAGTGVFGIRILAAGTVHVENVTISGFTNHGIHMNLANGATGSLYVKDSYIRTNETLTSRGINLQPVSGSANMTAVITNTHLEKMNVGLYVGDGGRATIRDSTINGMVYAGIVTEAASGNAQTNVENCIITHNMYGLQAGAGNTLVRLSNAMVINNSNKGLFVAGGQFVSFGNNSIGANGVADDAIAVTVPQI